MISNFSKDAAPMVVHDAFARDAVKVFKALGDPTRYEMLCMMLRDEEVSGARFHERFGLSAPTLSHHYRVLESAGLIESERRGQNMFYRANRERLRKFVPSFERVHVFGD